MFHVMLFRCQQHWGKRGGLQGSGWACFTWAQSEGSVPAGAAQGTLSRAPGGAGADGQLSQDRRRRLRHGGSAGRARSPSVWVAGAASLSPGLHRHAAPRPALQHKQQPSSRRRLREADVPRCQAQADVNTPNKTVPVHFPVRANGFELCNGGRG